MKDVIKGFGPGSQGYAIGNAPKFQGPTLRSHMLGPHIEGAICQELTLRKICPDTQASQGT